MSFDIDAFVSTYALIISYGWNKRILTWDDLEQICDSESISISEKVIDTDVRYEINSGVAAIILSPSLQKNARLAAAFHALGHHFETFPSIPLTTTYSQACILVQPFRINLFYAQEGEKNAHILAACAMLPKPTISKKTKDDIRKSYNFCAALLDLRYHLLWQFDI
jgi:hypothetical protein